jgi:hypothetical protein
MQRAQLAHFLLASLAAASRLAVRFLAAASDAILARAERSSGVEFRAAFCPPSLPNSRAISVIASRMWAGIFLLMSPMIHLTGYGDKVENSFRLALTP